MTLHSNGEILGEEIEEEWSSNATSSAIIYKDKCKNVLHISTSRKGLLYDETPEEGNHMKLLIIPNSLKLLKINTNGSLVSPSAKFRQIAEEKEEVSRAVPSPASHSYRHRFKGMIARRINWTSLWKMSIAWIKSPFNMVLLLWIICVSISGAILFLVMTGMLNEVLPNESDRNSWFEVNNQILNALFTLMCLYQHPKRVYYLVLLGRWNPEDISTLRKVFCKNGSYKPHEWMHMMVVVILLHVNCFAQYALCGLNLGYIRSERPAAGVGICLSVAIAAPATAGLYSIFSPLGREYDYGFDEEEQNQKRSESASKLKQQRRMSFEKRFSFAKRTDQMVEHAPVWKGGIFSLWENISTTFLSLCCTFCVFGWNMERLGFGNMYVHITTFLLFCTAPFWIFNLAAINVDSEPVREALGLTGIVLCIFGLLYGGFWRIQMRKRFNLPESKYCCGKPDVADCAQWLFCCCCSLAQEVRTTDHYDIVEDRFCQKQTNQNDNVRLCPLPREDGAIHSRLESTKLTRFGTQSPRDSSKHCHSSDIAEQVSMTATNHPMNPPFPPSRMYA